MKLSVIIPVVDAPVGSGRCPSYIKSAIKSVIDGGHDDFEALVGCDGSVPAIADMVASLKDERVKYHEFQFKGWWGNPQRTALQKIATGSHVTYLDHDDAYVPGATASIAENVECFPDKLLIFKLVNVHREIRWETRGRIEPTHIGQQMMVIPNDGEIPDWVHENLYASDWHFCVNVLRKYGEARRLWVPEVIQHLRPWATKSLVKYTQDLERLGLATSNNCLPIATPSAPAAG